MASELSLRGENKGRQILSPVNVMSKHVPAMISGTSKSAYDLSKAQRLDRESENVPFVEQIKVFEPGEAITQAQIYAAREISMTNLHEYFLRDQDAAGIGLHW